MKLFIVCSTSFYNKIKPIKEKLESKEIIVLLPNSYEESTTEHDYTSMTNEEYVTFFKEMYNLSRKKISEIDDSYFRTAEKFLYNEFSIVLNKTYDETKDYVINEVLKKK